MESQMAILTDDTVRPTYAKPTRLRSKTCHCGRRYRPNDGELCSLCHYAPLSNREYSKLSREARVAITQVLYGDTSLETEIVLTDYGLLIRDDGRDVGKAIDVFTGRRVWKPAK